MKFKMKENGKMFDCETFDLEAVCKVLYQENKEWIKERMCQEVATRASNFVRVEETDKEVRCRLRVIQITEASDEKEAN